MLLLLLPLAALGIGKMESQGENRIRIAVCTAQGTEQEASWLSRQLARNLAERAKGMFDFYLCASEQEVKDEVASRRAECGYAIDPNLEEKLNQKQWKKVIRLYTAPSTVAGPLSAETVFHELAALYNRELLQMYVTGERRFRRSGLLKAKRERRRQDRPKNSMISGMTAAVSFILRTYMMGKVQAGLWQRRREQSFFLSVALRLFLSLPCRCTERFCWERMR